MDLWRGHQGCYTGLVMIKKWLLRLVNRPLVGTPRVVALLCELKALKKVAAKSVL